MGFPREALAEASSASYSVSNVNKPDRGIDFHVFWAVRSQEHHPDHLHHAPLQRAGYKYESLGKTEQKPVTTNDLLLTSANSDGEGERCHLLERVHQGDDVVALETNVVLEA